MNDGTRAGVRATRRGPRRTAILAAALAGIALLAAACGGGGAPAGTGSTRYQKALAFAQCMRSRGALGFPDPSSQGTFDVSQAEASSPLVTTALKPCQKLLPPGAATMPAAQARQIEDQALRYSACLRTHGFPQFPDPVFKTSGGGIGVEFKVGPPMGIDTHSPQFQAAAQACEKLTGFTGP